MGIGRWIIAGAGMAALAGSVAFAKSRSTEQPPYDVLFAEEDFELREYAPMIVAQVTHTGSRMRARQASFRRLAAYIFAKDRPAGGEEIDMTSPVIHERTDNVGRIAMAAPVTQQRTDVGEWRMRFVMPSHYTMATLPKPPSDIALEEVSAKRLASVRFSGHPNDAELQAMEAKLGDWIARQGLTPTGEPQYAFYDAPMVPGPLRRNEVQIEVERR